MSGVGEDGRPTSRAAGTVLLTGATGLLGTWLRRLAPPEVTLVSVVHHRTPPGEVVTVDLRDAGATTAALAAVRPHLVIHAAYAREEASIVDATRHVAEAARRVGAELLAVSSEAVFSGDGRPRSERSRPDPVWDYGRWKARAEDLVRDLDPGAAIVRLPLLVSRQPEDHVCRDIRAGSRSGGPSTWFTDELRQPAGAGEVAAALWAIADLPLDQRGGVWHLPGPERLSRFEIAVRTAEDLGLDPASVVGAPTPADASRPRDLHLTGARAQARIGWSPQPVLRRSR
ncbi:sugar nucleotide-binding protein [Iamia majanohamensis]|uniref:dTDP-4-dehydrorhamnose reductase n=1 Tax=Iamia majanohamensis TaxID=467976 RepID=A0AAE9YCE2_9ACTN|nr:sugar nucleotide-binding protein [Iamia majanohamensis]WCO68623.1 sugar nucleotide-binding protein [Iamia majanohamensis]